MQDVPPSAKRSSLRSHVFQARAVPRGAADRSELVEAVHRRNYASKQARYGPLKVQGPLAFTRHDDGPPRATARTLGGRQTGQNALMGSQPRPLTFRRASARSTFMRAVFESDLPPSTRLLLLAIAWSAGADGSGSYVSVALLASRTGLKERQVRNLLLAAKQGGWLDAEPRPGRTNDWVLGVPECRGDPCTPVQGGVQPSAGGGCTPVQG